MRGQLPCTLKATHHHLPSPAFPFTTAHRGTAIPRRPLGSPEPPSPTTRCLRHHLRRPCHTPTMRSTLRFTNSGEAAGVRTLTCRMTSKVTWYPVLRRMAVRQCSGRPQVHLYLANPSHRPPLCPSRRRRTSPLFASETTHAHDRTRLCNSNTGGRVGDRVRPRPRRGRRSTRTPTATTAWLRLLPRQLRRITIGTSAEKGTTLPARDAGCGGYGTDTHLNGLT